MSALCERSIDPYAMHKAARVVSGQDGSTYARNDKFALEKIHFRTVTRLYTEWLEFGMLPVDITRKYF